MSLIAIKYERREGGAGALQLLDQRRLPFESTWRDVKTPEYAWRDIKDMVVRGAPVRRAEGRGSLQIGASSRTGRAQAPPQWPLALGASGLRVCGWRAGLGYQLAGAGGASVRRCALPAAAGIMPLRPRGSSGPRRAALSPPPAATPR